MAEYSLGMVPAANGGQATPGQEEKDSKDSSSSPPGGDELTHSPSGKEKNDDHKSHINQHKFVFDTYEQRQEKLASRTNSSKLSSASARERFSLQVQSITDREAARRSQPPTTDSAAKSTSSREEGELCSEVRNPVYNMITPESISETILHSIPYKFKLRSHSTPPPGCDRENTRSKRVDTPLSQRTEETRRRARTRTQSRPSRSHRSASNKPQSKVHSRDNTPITILDDPLHSTSGGDIVPSNHDSPPHLTAGGGISLSDHNPHVTFGGGATLPEWSHTHIHGVTGHTTRPTDKDLVIYSNLQGTHNPHQPPATPHSDPEEDRFTSEDTSSIDGDTSDNAEEEDFLTGEEGDQEGSTHTDTYIYTSRMSPNPPLMTDGWTPTLHITHTWRRVPPGLLHRVNRV